MELIFKQRLLAMFDSYDIFDENDNVVYTIKGQFSLGHKLNIFNSKGEHIATLKQVLLSFLPKYEIYLNDSYVGCITKKLSLFTPTYEIDCKNWSVKGNIFEWDYKIVNQNGGTVACISKSLLKLTDTYVINISNSNDAIFVLLFTLAIDAEKCSRN